MNGHTLSGAVSVRIGPGKELQTSHGNGASRRSVLLLALALLLVVGVAGLSYRSALGVRSAAERVSVTQTILRQARQLQALVTDAETGQRGFLLTRDPHYLAPYRFAVTALPGALLRLDELTADSPDQQQRVAELASLVGRKLAELDATLVADRTRGAEAALRIVRGGEGQAVMDDIRANLAALVDRESQRLIERQAAITRTTRDATYMTVGALAVAAVTTALAAAVLVGGVRGRERRRAEHAQREIRAEAGRRVAAIVENSDDAIIGKDLAGIITSWNPGAERMFGYGAAEAIGRPITLIIPPERHQEEDEVLARLRRGERIDHFETVRITKHGRLLDVSLTVSPLRDETGRVVGASKIGRDITERKRTEADLKHLNETLEQRVAERTRQLEEINVELDAFGYTVSHDLRAPLRAMHGFATALATAYADKLDERGHDFARRIVIAAGQMDQLIQDLLAYSRLSRDDLRVEPVSLGNVVRDALATLESDLRQRRAVVDVAGDLGHVMANPRALAQVVANLVSNAVKFVAAAETPQLAISAAPRDGWVRLTVRDNGIGIDPAYHDRVFRVFERLHGPETYPGTGIGLAIVRRGIERMGGRFGLESALGAGATFWIELPAVRRVDGS